jgi:hypothetical protein
MERVLLISLGFRLYILLALACSVVDDELCIFGRYEFIPLGQRVSDLRGSDLGNPESSNLVGEGNFGNRRIFSTEEDLLELLQSQVEPHYENACRRWEGIKESIK